MYNQVPVESMTDAYKIGMSQLHSLTVFDMSVEILDSYSNFTPRKNAYMTFSELSDERIVIYGTRDTFLNVHRMFDKTFFSEDRDKVIARITRRIRKQFGCELDHAKFIRDMGLLHDLGYLPIEVRSIDEGTRYPLGLPMFTVRATVESFGWLVNFIETLTSGLIWPMTNTATMIEQFYLQARHWGLKTSPKAIVAEWLKICVHEFGMRGYRGPQDQIRTSSCHSLFFAGSDTGGVIDFFEDSYGPVREDDPVAGSVRATEHADISRMLSLFRQIAKLAIEENGDLAVIPFENRQVRAVDVLENTEYYVLEYFIRNSTGIISYVADTENYYRLLNEYARLHKDLILDRKPRADGQPAIFVFRPDSSRRTPLTVICGYRIVQVNGKGASFYMSDNINVSLQDQCYVNEDGRYFLIDRHNDLIEITEEEAKGSLESLWDIFGGEVIGGYKHINPAVSLLYGEAISQKHQLEIYTRMEEMGFAATNILMGKGSYASLEGNTRDLFSMSYKQTFSVASIDGVKYNLPQQKTPMGDASKTSARGLLQVIRNGEDYELLQDVTEKQASQGCLTLLYRNGEFYKEQSLDDIRDTYAEDLFNQIA